MTALTADTSSIDAFAADIIAGAERNLDAALATLSTQWSGEAQVAYIAAQARWLDEMAQLSAIANAAGAASRAWASGLVDIERDLATGWPA